MDELLNIKKISDYKVVDQLQHTPSIISMLSLLMNYVVHRDSLMKVLEQAYIDHNIIVENFTGVVGNITACNNLSFCDEDFPEEGKNHNWAFHISMNYKEDSLSNVLIDIESSLNVMPKSTLSKLAYGGTPMRYSSVIVKAFDG